MAIVPCVLSEQGEIKGFFMANAVICHGVKFKEDFDKMEIPFCASYWFPWLQQKLILSGVPTQVPSFTNSWLPARSYALDVDILSRQHIDDETILIGHSCGGGLLVKYLSENPHIKIGHLILVAPWIDAAHVFPQYFNNFEPDPDLINRVGTMDLFYSDDDHFGDMILSGCKKLQEIYPSMRVHRFADRSHFSGNMRKFPEIWGLCRSFTDK